MYLRGIIKPRIMKKFFLLLFALAALALQGQTLTERLLWADSSGTADEIELYNHMFSFDRDGNYCFCVKRDGNSTIVSNKAPIEGLCYAGGGFSKGCGSRYLRLCSQKDADPLYVMNEGAPNFYGPIAGTVQGYLSGNTRQHFANTSVRNDTAFFYLDGRLVYSSPLVTIKQFKLEDEDWVDFSENGNVIYYLEQNDRFVLYVNGQPIDTSDLHFNALAINDKGDYLYTEIVKPENPVGKYDYMFFIHTKDTVFDYVRTTWRSVLTENGAYYFNGDDCGPDYLVLNGRLRKGIESFKNITLVDSKNAFYTYEIDKQLYLNVNGKDYPVDFDGIYNPTMDTNGHFAYFGMKGYYLYKVVDNVKVEEPLSKYGVRAIPIHITPQGSSLHYFKTDDTVYLYRDNELLFKPIHGTETFTIQSWDHVLPRIYAQKPPENGHSLVCLNYGDYGFFVHDGQLSEPLPPLADYYAVGDSEFGSVVEGVYNEHGYFAVLKVGEKDYQVVVNGRICGEIHDVDKVFPRKGYLDAQQVTFYGMRNNAIYQFVVTL